MRSLFLRLFFAVALTLMGCGDGAGETDGGLDAARPMDATPPPMDAPPPDDASLPDAAPPVDAGACGAQDVREGAPCGPSEDPAIRWRWDGTECAQIAWCRCEGADCDDLFGEQETCERTYAECLDLGCDEDADCASGERWCEEGTCVPCDNDGLLCDIACADGWAPYMRNGCSPCECAPPNQCEVDSDCPTASDGRTQKCYAGAFCWCDPAIPGCCRGNVCAADGCVAAPPTGCRTRGCPRGQTCDATAGCEPSNCGCDETGFWICTSDCGGGACE
ncbi:MAG: hypothetical protein VYE22_08935 [Myxococcota bacterium]|nr:hypothetical protein [Myxococcota bacterium]